MDRSLSLKACSKFFFFNDTATTEIYTLSLHDALPISDPSIRGALHRGARRAEEALPDERRGGAARRSEEHTSELQSQSNLVCRLLLEKKNESTTRYPGLCTLPYACSSRTKRAPIWSCT